MSRKRYTPEQIIGMLREAECIDEFTKRCLAIVVDRKLNSGHCHVKRSDFDRLFSVACRDANHLLHTPSIST